MSEVSRRKFLFGSSAAVAVAALATSTSLMADQTATTPTTEPVVPPPPKFDEGVDPSLWFDAPEYVAKVGAAPLGMTITGTTTGVLANRLKTAQEYAAAIEEEQGCGTLLQAGGWFLTPTEVAVAQRIHRNTA